MKILLADKNQLRKDRITNAWQRQRLVCDIVEDDCAVTDFTAIAQYDAIIIGSQGDPRMHPYTIKTLRDAKESTPIVVLLDEFKSELGVECLNAGADNVLYSLMNPTLLLASLHAITRRMHGRAESLITIGALRLNETARTLYVGDHYIHLTATEYAIVAQLMKKAPHSVSNDAIVHNLYGDFDVPMTAKRMLHVVICRVRKKLAKVGAEGYLITRTRFGLLMAEPSK